MLSHDRPLSDIEFVAFDLETTGLSPVVNRIVEFGAVRFRLDGCELGTWEQLVDPECLIPPGVTEIHGITDAMVQGQPTLPQALPGFLDFLGTPDTILLAHNATFDLGLKCLCTVEDFFRLSPPLTADKSRTHVIEPPAGFEDLAVAISEQRTVVIAYDGGTRGPADRRITPRAMLQSNGRQYLIAYCHSAKLEKTYRVDRIREIHAADVCGLPDRFS